MTYRKESLLNLISFLSYKQELIYQLSVRKALSKKTSKLHPKSCLLYKMCVLPPTRKWAKRYLSIKSIRTRPTNTE